MSIAIDGASVPVPADPGASLPDLLRKGVADTDGLRPSQAACIERHGFQCGYRMPGQICSAIGMTPLRHACADEGAGAVRLGAEPATACLGGGINLVDPMLAHMITKGTSTRIRTMPMVGGNVPHGTHRPCLYDTDFYDTDFYDTDGSGRNTRAPGQDCDARDRLHAILRSAEVCVVTHSSDTGLAPGDLIAASTCLRCRSQRTGPIARSATGRATASRRSRSPRRRRSGTIVSPTSASRRATSRTSPGTLTIGAALRGGQATETAVRDAAAEFADARPRRDEAFEVELATRILAAILDTLAGAAARPSSTVPGTPRRPSPRGRRANRSRSTRSRRVERRR